MRKSFLVLVFLISVSALAQQKATTADGKEVLLNPDGTWQYLVSPVARGGESKTVNPPAKSTTTKDGAQPSETTATTPSKSETLSGEKTANGKDIYVGPRGGRYHYSASGKKVYERKKR